jgi:small-conductance mechanosensitive channel
MSNGHIQLAQTAQTGTGAAPPGDQQLVEPAEPPTPSEQVGDGVSVESLSALATDSLSFFQTWLTKIGITSTATGLQWAAIQFAMILAAFAAALVLDRTVTPSIERRVRLIRGKPHLLRVIVIFLRRSRWIFFALSLWIVLAIMREVTWISRSYLVGIAANLATAWVVIAIVSRLIRNRFIANAVAVFAWSVAALSILNLLPQTIALLDSFGFQVASGVRVTPLLAIKAIMTVGIAVWLALLLGRFADNKFKQSEDLNPSLQVLLGKLVKAILIVTAILAALSMVGIDLTALAVFSGAIGLGIGFGLQKVVSNLISGFILLVDKSIKPGDVISVGDTYGKINELAARYASVISRDGREYLIPNEDLITSQVINWSYSSDLVRIDLDFGVSYEANPHDVRDLAKKVAASHKRVQAVPAPVCHITEFADSSINYKLRFWIRDPGQGTVNVRGDIFLALWDALMEAGIEIPYPHRDVAMRGPITVELADRKPPAKRAAASKKASKKAAGD